jgi:predicted nuclease of restriction endonuclease-like (RecB) superfamily
MDTNLSKDTDFKQWMAELKGRIRRSQIKAAIKVNSELLHLYWDLGKDIVVRQMDAKWGTGFFAQVSKELKQEFPNMHGFSVTTLKYCKYFYLFYSQGSEEGETLLSSSIRQQAVDELNEHPVFNIPWGHHVVLMNKCNSVHEALFYVQKTIENGWSRAMLMNFIEVDLYNSQGKAVNNFSHLLPDAQSDLAQEVLKDPYTFDFITLTEGYKERELEAALVDNITKFLLELGQGFAYVGRQVPIQIGAKEKFIDLLFYHLKLRCYIVIELKATDFEAAHTGQLGLYVSAVNHLMKAEADNPTIGLLICKTKDNIEAQYSLESSSQPLGISEYQLSKLLPKDFKSSLPSIEEIEKELGKE